MSSCRLVIIADDLSGALDTAAPFAARGADARVVISLEALATTLEAWQGQWPAVIAVNTESRHLPAEAAALRVIEAVRLLTRVAPQQWFKKVDSTLRGQVVAECKALREALGLPLLLAPAVPAQGRLVRNAEVWVDGLPLAETDYQQDARSAPLAGPIDVAFAAGGLTLQRYRPGQETPLPGEDCIADAANDEELAAIYALLDTGSRHAMAGAAGLATAMAHRCFGAAESSRRSLHNVNKVLYTVGSRSARAAEQLMQLRQHFSHLGVIEANADKLVTRASNACVVVPETGTQRTAGEVSGAMAAQVASITSHWQQDDEGLLFLTGGDIAMAVLTRLGAHYICVENEWSPGVALGYMDGDKRRRVMTKAGGFGDSHLLVRLHEQFSLPSEHT